MSNLLDLPAYDPDHWQARAQCFIEKVDPERMAPETASPEQLAEAKAVCGRCPVRAECLEAGRAQGDAFGLWGGEWFGTPPRGAGQVACGWCGTLVVDTPGGSPRRFCGSGCRMALKRAQERAAALVPA